MKKKESLKTIEHKTIFTLIITLSLMIIILGTSYISILSGSAQNGYALEQEKLKKEELTNNLQRIKTTITDTSSLSTLENSKKINEMEEPDSKTYITK